jgi:hypothetical protein
MKIFLSALFGLCVVMPLAAQHDHSTPAVPGAEKSGKTKLLEAGAEMLQREGPLRSIHASVCGFHFYSGEPERQVIAHHFCAHLNDEVRQCVIYDSNKPDARLIGVEYIISARLFETLPAEEKKLWHSHRYEVKSGTLVALGLPAAAENELMEELVTTYGKTWHFWQVDRGDPLPYGAPQLMMGFTQDGQLKPEIQQQRDKAYGVSTEEKRKQREKLPDAAPHPEADAWQKGPAMQTELRPVDAASGKGQSAGEKR